MRNGYAFSDGNGVMGIAVAQSIQASMRLKTLPGAVQIRMGGVKGMLSLKLDFEAKSIGIRPSQVKFRSSHRVLEVKKVATVGDNTNKLFKETLLVSCQCQRCFIFIKLLLYLCSLLFFCIIKVMDHLGILCSTFYNLHEQACPRMLLKYDVDDALDTFAKSQTSNADETAYLRNALEYGTKRNGQRFQPSELQSIRESMCESREKVNLPCSDVHVMFGIIDEHDVLEEGEVLV